MAIASDTRHTEERRGALAHVFQVAVDFIPHDPVVVNKAVMWLAVLAREWGCFSEDKWSDERRTQCFDDLGVWLRSGWKSLPPWKIGSLQRLSSVEPKVSLAALHQYEDRVGMILPLDLRRLLLEVGDVGTALFGVPLEVLSLVHLDRRKTQHTKRTSAQLAPVRRPLYTLRPKELHFQKDIPP
jgi:hypothetical protein